MGTCARCHLDRFRQLTPGNNQPKWQWVTVVIVIFLQYGANPSCHKLQTLMHMTSKRKSVLGDRGHRDVQETLDKELRYSNSRHEHSFDNSISPTSFYRDESPQQYRTLQRVHQHNSSGELSRFKRWREEEFPYQEDRVIKRARIEFQEHKE
jgi:hypothetical protein